MSIEPFIKCSDMQQSLAFYTETLDFNIRVKPDPDPEAFMSMYALLERDGDLVHLSAHAGDGVFGNVIFIRVDEIECLYTYFVDRGLNTDFPTNLPALTMPLVEQTWGIKEFAVKDPDGNRLTFGQ